MSCLVCLYTYCGIWHSTGSLFCKYIFLSFILCNFLLQTLQCTESLFFHSFVPWRHWMFCLEKVYSLTLVLSQKKDTLGDLIFFTYCPNCPKRPKIENSCWTCVSRYICLLIWGLDHRVHTIQQIIFHVVLTVQLHSGSPMMTSKDKCNWSSKRKLSSITAFLLLPSFCCIPPTKVNYRFR